MQRHGSAQRVCQLRDELQFIEPLIWRVLLVPDTLSLPKLDRVILACFGWTNRHLHACQAEGRR